MQTFLPYPDFSQSAQALDYRRLNKQVLEADQILKALGGASGWARHPATRMWRGYEVALICYRNTCLREWIRRGYNSTRQPIEVRADLVLPWWMGHELFHPAHRSNLLRKDPLHYGQFGWAEPPDLPYFWPVD